MFTRKRIFLRNAARHLLEDHKPAKHRNNTCKNKKTVWDSLKEIFKVELEAVSQSL